MNMNPEKYFKRARGILRPELLREKPVVVVGLGSGGSRVATELGRLGLRLLLIDRPGECLEEHNILRHELGYRSLGKPKTTELADHIRNYNPAAQIATAECDVTAQPERFDSLLLAQRVDLILGCTDNQPSTHALNAAAVRHSIPLVGAAVYDGGVGGHVFRTGPKEACYACIADYLNLRNETQDKPATIDYSNPDLDALQSTCALNLDIAQIALIQARTALQVLLGSETNLTDLPREVNLIIFANRVHPKAFPRPLHPKFYVIPPNPNCLICGHPQGDSFAREVDAIL
jgi:molybdopterin/thiamine biosynthesis adenylyltransferase